MDTSVDQASEGTTRRSHDSPPNILLPLNPFGLCPYLLSPATAGADAWLTRQAGLWRIVYNSRAGETCFAQGYAGQARHGRQRGAQRAFVSARTAYSGCDNRLCGLRRTCDDLRDCGGQYQMALHPLHRPGGSRQCVPGLCERRHRFGGQAPASGALLVRCRPLSCLCGPLWRFGILSPNLS